MTGHNRKYGQIARRLIRTCPEFEDIKDSGVRIAYLASDKEKTKNRKTVFAECTKVDDKYSWCCEYDFFITVYEPNIEDFTEEQIEILMRHELMHVGIDFEGDGTTFYIVPHDIEEFWGIIDKFGLEWSDTDGARRSPE